MNTKLILSVIFSTALIISSCKKKKGDVPDTPPAAKKVYVAGYEQNSAGFYVGKYWVDTTLTSIAVAGSDVELYDIEVFGADVYVFGQVDPQASGQRKYSIWKNGSILYDNVASANFNPSGTSLVVSGSDIYLCGESYSATAPTQRPAVWKNGTVTILPQSLAYSYATNIFVDGSVVYVLGRDYNSTQEVAVLWKNGVREVIAGCEQASSIFVTGTDVYVAGNDTESNAAYWKNGTKTVLPVPTTSNASSTGIKVIGTDVYVSGVESLATGVDVAVYWKNGIRTPLATAGSGFNSESFGIDVEGNNVYVCGWVERNAAGDYSAAIWKNAVLINLTPASSYAEALSVVVK